MIVADKLILGGFAAVALIAGGWDGVPDDGPPMAALATTGDSIGHVDATRGADGALVAGRSLDGLFRVPVVIDGTTITMIVDTGASRTIVSSETARRIPELLASADHGGRIRTLSGDQSFRTVAVREIRIDNRRMTDLELAVMDTPDGISVLGHDVLRHMGPITLDGNRLIVR